MGSAVWVCNGYVEADPTMQNIFEGKPVIIYPALADEGNQELSGVYGKSYPYIRYISIPVIDPRNFRIRRDQIQYVAGSKDLTQVNAIMERLIELLDIDDAYPMPFGDPTGEFKIQSCQVTTGLPFNPPNQDEGVWEQGINVSLTYTKVG